MFATNRFSAGCDGTRRGERAVNFDLRASGGFVGVFSTGPGARPARLFLRLKEGAMLKTGLGWRRVGAWSILLAVLVAGGCSLGPRMLEGNRAQYNMKLQQSASQQMLVNLVRVKYFEPPFFMQVGAVNSTFNYQLEPSLLVEIPEAMLHKYSLQLLGQYTERPTITYVPLEGEDYVNRVLAEVEMERFQTLYRSGWSLELLMRILVAQMGDLRNMPSADSAQGRDPYEAFLELAGLMGALQQRGETEMVLVPGPESVLTDDIAPGEVSASAVMTADQGGYRFAKGDQGSYRLCKPGSPQFAFQLKCTVEEADRVCRLLGIRPERVELADGKVVIGFRLARGRDLRRSLDRSGKMPEVPLKLRSFVDALFYLAQGIEVPAKDVEKGVTLSSYTTPEGKGLDLLSVRCGEARPSSAYVAVSYRGKWFWIDDSDIRSKWSFGLLNTLFSLQSGNAQGSQPVLTIPVSN